MMAELILALHVSSATGSDSNPGTVERPFQSILKASQAAKPGTTVHVAPGTYAGGFQTTASGTAAAPIRYVSDVKWGARIVPPRSGGGREAWDNRGANVVIDGFEIDGGAAEGGAAGGTPWLFGLYTAGSNSVVRNMKVHGIARSAAAMGVANTGQGGAGIMADGWAGGTGMTVTGNEVYDIGPAKRSSGLVHGVYMATSGLVQNNLVYQIAGDGVTSWHDATNLTIVNNTVFQARGAGIMIGSGDHYHGGAPHDHSTVSNNIVYDNRKGIEEHGALGSHNSYSNNLVHGNRADWRLRTGKATGSIDADPEFVNYRKLGGGDYRLAARSPAVDAGLSEGAPATDIDGVPRPQGKGIDVGAHERVPEAPERREPPGRQLLTRQTATSGGGQ
ncbi:choice-of-anchor Q domain-containing protein [Azospirillum doebereinerae]